MHCHVRNGKCRRILKLVLRPCGDRNIAKSYTERILCDFCALYNKVILSRTRPLQAVRSVELYCVDFLSLHSFLHSINFLSNVSIAFIFQAVAFGARFIKLGGPVRAEHVSKYRRLQQIEQELEQRGCLAPQEQHVFPVINVVEQGAEDSEQK